MAPPSAALCAFATPTPLLAPRVAAVATSRCAAARMSAGGDSDGAPKKKQSLVDWVLSKTMPHQDEGDEFGYEPFFQKSMQAREDAKKAEYEKES
jgi:hypothetical protein